MRKLLLLTLLLLPWTVNSQDREENEVVMVQEEDPEMLKAIQKARDTLDDFLKIYINPEPGMSGFKIKVAVSDDYGTEHFWIKPFTPRGGEFDGVISNVPKIVRSVEQGQSIHFTRMQVSDWGYVHDGKQVGSFTVCVLFKNMPVEQANYYREKHGFQC